MDSSSDSDSETQKSTVSRLGDCEVCGKECGAIYTCPRCEVKTCCLECVRTHKKELECDGIRDRTKFIRMKDFSDSHLLSDYRMLEECARFAHGMKRNYLKRFTRVNNDLPVHLWKLKLAARKRGTVMQFLTQNFTRHAINTTRYNFKENIIYWRVEWIFPNAEPNAIKFADDKCSEQEKLSKLLHKYLNGHGELFDGDKTLAFYRSVGLNGVRVLLKAEKVPGSSHKYYELDACETLAENLSGKCIIEFPLIFVVLKDHALNFDIILTDDESEEEVNNEQSTNEMDTIDNTESNNVQRGKKQRELLTQKIAKKKRMDIKKEIKEQNKRKPKNLLFTTGYSSEESIQLSDIDEQT